ncbi:peptide-methionine (S)-S-oxide reductase MsrA [Primorskyibacter sp. S187A]|uniref:peptide-methionine (S)-S-oxide reductase MsrA n=1 Tax=Primorskyibacter sp. S187A TaxID=3415130 RepID=UPI003C7BAEE7
MARFTNIKLFLLGLTIALGMVAKAKEAHAQSTETIIVAGGCFWCVESDFEKVRGVKEAVSGFTGGSIANPTYKQVTKGGSGHLEAVKITFNPNQVSARQLYDMFFRSIDPTDAGGQFCDRGKSYSTAIFVTNSAQNEAAKAAKSNAQAALGRKIVTPIKQASAFYAADEYHQDYYKSKDRILTRFGPLTKAKAYKRYRTACGRDARVKELWGSAAPFVGG